MRTRGWPIHFFTVDIILAFGSTKSADHTFIFVPAWPHHGYGIAFFKFSSFSFFLHRNTIEITY